MNEATKDDCYYEAEKVLDTAEMNGATRRTEMSRRPTYLVASRSVGRSVYQPVELYRAGHWSGPAFEITLANVIFVGVLRYRSNHEPRDPNRSRRGVRGWRKTGPSPGPLARVPPYIRRFK